MDDVLELDSELAKQAKELEIKELELKARELELDKREERMRRGENKMKSYLRRHFDKLREQQAEFFTVMQKVPALSHAAMPPPCPSTPHLLPAFGTGTDGNSTRVLHHGPDNPRPAHNAQVLFALHALLVGAPERDAEGAWPSRGAQDGEAWNSRGLDRGEQNQDRPRGASRASFTSEVRAREAFKRHPRERRPSS